MRGESRNEKDLFELQYKIDENKKITLLTNFIENNQREEKNSRILEYFGKCEYFDENNCQPVVVNQSGNKPFSCNSFRSIDNSS